MEFNEVYDKFTKSPRNVDVEYNGAPEDYEDPADYDEYSYHAEVLA